ncbi:hypothetical protein Pla110_17240 [Polystyrenella longa]|uniref:Uncharacterized protein n=1 Tax=Polystyrenella longa TaxID=2528007 RepID=A0A518CL97_9PLAN|nr:hypothetical protein [Polystyrenella longa]QDU80002.1 hypothetical protein Pla110_17240 [Polystyrenella longa]
MRFLLSTLILASMGTFPVDTMAEESHFYTIPLEDHANQPTEETFAPSDYPGDDLSELPSGKQKLGTVEYDLPKSVIQMTGKHLENQKEFNAPEKIENIFVGAHLERLHILHAARWGAYGKRNDQLNHWAPDGLPIAYYEVVYSDNTSEVIPVVYGVDVRDWWSVWDERKPVLRGEVVWRGSNPHLRRRQDPQIVNVRFPLRLYHLEWSNPHPEKMIDTINIVSLNQIPALFTVALSGETQDPPSEIETRRRIFEKREHSSQTQESNN